MTQLELQPTTYKITTEGQIKHPENQKNGC